MDYFFDDDFYGESNFVWPDYQDVPVPPRVSAFVPYTSRPRIEVGSERIGSTSTSNPRKASKRIIEYLRRIQPTKVESRETQRDRGHLHAINERIRRNREKLNYMALHSLLPPGSRSDKNSIVQVAAKSIQELECHKQELEKRKQKLNEVLGTIMAENSGGTKIGVRVINPISGIDYMLGALKFLKDSGSRIKNIQSEFSHQKLTAVIHVDNDQMAEAELKDTVRGALKEVEEKLLVTLPGSLPFRIRKRTRLENDPSNPTSSSPGYTFDHTYY